MKTNKTILAAVAFFLLGATAYAQEGRVGVNTSTPKTTLDVNGKTDATGNLLTTDITGLQAPRLTRAELTAKGNTLYGTDQRGALVYITDISAGDALSQRINVTANGYYYFDGSVWQKITIGNYWSINGNSSTNPPTSLGTSVGTNNYWGTTDAKNLAIATNSITRAIVDQSGNFYGGNGNTVANTSNNSFIWGRNNSLTGTSLSNGVFGDGNTLTGSHNLVWGTSNNITTTNRSGIFGDQNLVSTSNQVLVSGFSNDLTGISNATALGYDNTVSSNNAFANGERNTINSNSVGASAMGQWNNVTGYASGAFGNLSTVNGDVSFSIGNQNNVKAKSSFAAGDGNTINNEYGYAIGISNTLNGSYSFAAGNSNISAGQNTINIGTQNNVTSTGTMNTAVGIGNTNIANGNRAIAIGYNNKVQNDQSVGIGSNTTVTHSNSFAFGDGATSAANNSFTSQFTGGYRLFSNGGTVGVSLSAGGSSWTSISDRRSKENIEELKYGLKTVMSLKPKIYNYIGNKAKSLGFIAQDVQTVIPEIIEETKMGENKDFLGIKYSEIIPILTKAIQEQQKEIDELKRRISVMESK